MKVFNDSVLVEIGRLLRLVEPGVFCVAFKSDRRIFNVKQDSLKLTQLTKHLSFSI